MGQNLGFFTRLILKYFETVQHIRDAFATDWYGWSTFSWFWSAFEQVGKRRGLGWRGFGAVGAKMNQFLRFFAIS